MTKLILFEDEPNALRRLKRMISEIRPDWSIVNSADCISDGIKIANEENYDLIVSDIQLSDGTCFDILKKAEIATPVIFITAFDEYAIKAFDFNSIHYLLKPIKLEQLHLAFQKFEQNKMHRYSEQSALFESESDFEKKLLSKVGNTTAVIDYSNIAFVTHFEKMTKAYVFTEDKYLLDQSLDRLEEFLPHNQFFRINRQVIVNKRSINTFSSYSSDRIILTTSPSIAQELIVSKEKTPKFRRWMMMNNE